jgi:hypothetical protein
MKLPPTAGRVLGIPALALTAASLLAALVWVVSGRPDWGTGVLAGVAAVVFAFIVSAPIVLYGLRGKGSGGQMALLAAGGARIAAAIPAAVLLVAIAKYPPIATFLTVIPLYVVVMIAETREILRTDWNTART